MREPKYPIPHPGTLDTYMVFSDRIDLAILVSVCKEHGCIMLHTNGYTSLHTYEYVSLGGIRRLEL